MSKKHMPLEEKGWKFKRHRSGEKHITNCTDGYCRVPTLKLGIRMHEVHHVLCVHACSDETLPKELSPDEIDFIRECLKISDWDINDGHNNIGLPKKWAYVLDSHDRTGWDNLPCHQVDHDLYLKALEDWMKDEVWNKIAKNKKEKECEVMTGDNVVRLFKMGSVTWKRFLRARGRSYGGTKSNIHYWIFSEKPDPAKEATWYIPFSMAFHPSTIRRRNPPRFGVSLIRKGLLTMIK